MPKFFRIRKTITRPADNTAYSFGDELSNSATAGLVDRMVFDMAGFRNIRLHSCTMEVIAASGNVVTTNLGLECYFFRTDEVLAAVGDNVAHPISAQYRGLAVGYFNFDDGAWWGPTGQGTAGTSQTQTVGLHLAQPNPSPTNYIVFPAGAIFNMDDVDTKSLTCVVRAMNTWTPTGIANTIGVTLYFEAD